MMSIYAMHQINYIRKIYKEKIKQLDDKRRYFI